MNLRNNSKEIQTVLDAGDGAGRTVHPGQNAEPPFTKQCVRELLASFPEVWGKADAKPAAEAKTRGTK